MPGPLTPGPGILGPGMPAIPGPGMPGGPFMPCPGIPGLHIPGIPAQPNLSCKMDIAHNISTTSKHDIMPELVNYTLNKNIADS